MKKAPAKGQGRLHVLRVLDAIVGKSLNKHGPNDKYSALLPSATLPTLRHPHRAAGVHDSHIE
jgi:hypothetical protein